MLIDYSVAFGVKYSILRYFNAAGCDPDGLIVERQEPETHLIPRALMAPAGLGHRFTFSARIATLRMALPSGTISHATGLAEAHWLAFERLSRGTRSIILNLGTGIGHSVVVRADPPVLVATTRKAADVLGFSPRHLTLHTIVQTAWQGVKSIHGSPSLNWFSHLARANRLSADTASASD